MGAIMGVPSYYAVHDVEEFCGITHDGSNPNLKDLSLPFSVFCKKNGVELTQDVWIGPFTSFGYGYFDEIPAAYVLKYVCRYFSHEMSMRMQQKVEENGAQYEFRQEVEKILV